jgi:membrane protein
VWSAIKGWFRRMLRKSSVRHGIRALERFNARLGLQFAGALTYFSFLAVVPIIMVSFSAAGFVLASQPGLLETLQDSITSLLPGSLASQIKDLLEEAINARFTVGVIGLVVALYSGVSWMGNLRSAIQAMWRPDFDSEQEIAAETIWGYYLKSLGYLVALTVGISLSLTLTTLGTSAQSVVLDWFGLDKVSALTPLFTVVPILLAVLTDMAIFFAMYKVLSPNAYPAARKALLRGSGAAAVAFEILKFALTYLLPTLLSSATAKIFGPIIGILIFFNLVATVVLFLAAWIATSSGSRAGETPRPFVRSPHGARDHRQAGSARQWGLEPGVLEQVDGLAAQEGRSREDVLRSAVAGYLAAHRH